MHGGAGDAHQARTARAGCDSCPATRMQAQHGKHDECAGQRQKAEEYDSLGHRSSLVPKLVRTSLGFARIASLTNVKAGRRRAPRAFVWPREILSRRASIAAIVQFDEPAPVDRHQLTLAHPGEKWRH
ncbi:hypothetical protein C0Z18_00025 [Trinickia dabaoshanensis]|uniref:Uncharacterized protein n=1 Tax=Trinickia dabaoshanensis TaxID=564714 RepID=A0A2N7W2I7_9BURK|nr:hypothetical protein C0Z18_00025 [Trinickia dabaoshanensis]